MSEHKPVVLSEIEASMVLSNHVLFLALSQVKARSLYSAVCGGVLGWPTGHLAGERADRIAACILVRP